MNKIKKIVSWITLIFVALAVWGLFTSKSDMVGEDGELLTMWQATVVAFKSINIWVLILLIPEQILMYYSSAQMYFAFLQEHKGFNVSTPKLTRISLEINFVNHAIPSGGMSGMAYLMWRLKEYKISVGQISFIHVLRYAICALANTVQTWIAIVIVLFTGVVAKNNGYWALWLAGGVALGIELLIGLGWLIVRKQKRIDWLSDKAVRGINKVVRKLTRGKRRKYLKEETVATFFNDLRGYYLRIMRQKKILIKPFIWGIVYSFLELATYWVVACALGHPEILPQIMIAEGVASVVGTVMVTPGGMGGYEGAFIALMIATGVNPEIATVTVIVTRVCVLLGTIVTGYPFYQLSLMKREDKFNAAEEEKRIESEKAQQA